MAEVQAYFPLPQPLDFAEKDAVFNNDKYGYPRYRKAHHYYSLKRNDPQRRFYQPFTYTETIVIYVDRNYVSGPGITPSWNYTEVLAYSEDNELITTYTASATITNGNNYAPDGTTPLKTEVFKINPATQLSNYSKVYFVARVHMGDGSAAGVGDTTKDFISNPVLLSSSHEGTVLMSYRSSTNKDRVQYESDDLNVTFQTRFYSDGMIYQQGGETTTFVDQDESTKSLYSKSAKKFLLDVGGVNGLPVYMMDIIDYATRCDTLVIDNELYRRIEEEMPAITDDSLSIQNRTITLQQVDIDSTKYFKQDSFTVWERPATAFGTYNYAIDEVKIQQGAQIVVLSGEWFSSESDENAYVSALNTAMSAAGASSTFTNSTGTITFDNAAGENWQLVKDVIVLDKEVVYTIDNSTINETLRITHIYSGNLQNEPLFVDAGNSSQSGTNLSVNGRIDVDLTYPSVQVYTARFFSRDITNTIAISSYASGNNPKITNIAGALPASLVNWNVKGHDIPTLNLRVFDNCANVITTMVFDTCDISTITTGWASNLVSGSYKPYQSMQRYDFRANALTGAKLDAFADEIFDSTAFRNYGTLITFQQTTSQQLDMSSTPTPGTKAYQLDNDYGWYVVYTP